MLEQGETYLADGVYASFDGLQIKLRAPREHGDHVVYLDGEVLAAFEYYVARLKKERATGASKENR